MTKKLFKGQGGKGGGPSAITVASASRQTIRSKAYATVVDLLGEGVMGGFVDVNGNPVIDAILDPIVDENGTISEVLIVEGGLGYPSAETFDCTVTGEGTGASVTMTTNSVGKVVSVSIVEAGSGYVHGTTKVIAKPITGASIYFDKVQLQNPSSLNYQFEGVSLEFRLGLFNQAPLEKVNATETTIGGIPIVGTNVEYQTPLSFTIQDQPFDRIRLGIALDRLYRTRNNGGLAKTTLAFRITYDYQSDSMQTPITKIPYGGQGDKTDGFYSFEELITSKYTLTLEFPVLVNRKDSGHTWTFKIERITRPTGYETDEDLEEIQVEFKKFSLDFAVGINTLRLNYPNSALVCAKVDAETFRRIPVRGYRVSGIEILVPSNYRPRGTLTYDADNNVTGVRSTAMYVDDDGNEFPVEEAGNLGWDGTFYRSVCDNPAWILLAMLTHHRYGFGGIIKAVDKWTLYRIAQWCDEEVPDGYGGLEPRFTANVYIQNKRKAFEALQSIASIFRGILYWTQGEVRFSADRPRETRGFFNNSNVENGVFTYSGTAGSARHTVAVCKYTDRRDTFKPDKVEYVPDLEGILRYGIREKDLTAIGATSRGQARRYGLSYLVGERLESESVAFRTGLEAVSYYPGDVIEVADRRRSGVDASGRVVSMEFFQKNGLDYTRIIADRPYMENGEEVDVSSLEAQNGVTLIIQRPKANVTPDELDAFNTGSVTPEQMREILTRQIAEYPVSNVTIDENRRLQFEISGNVDQDPANVVGMVYGIKTPTVPTRKYWVVKREEISPAIYEIVAAQYAPAKYGEIDSLTDFTDPGFNTTPDLDPFLRIGPVTNITINVSYREESSTPYHLTIGWTPPVNSYVTGYRLWIRKVFENYSLLGETQTNLFETDVAEPTIYYVRIVAVGLGGATSEPAVARVRISDLTVENPDTGDDTPEEPEAPVYPGLEGGPGFDPRRGVWYETVTGLELLAENGEGLASGTSYTGKNCHFRWRTNSPLLIGDLFSGSSMGVLKTGKEHSPNFLDWRIRVRDQNGDLLHEAFTESNSYIFTLEQNLEATKKQNLLLAAENAHLAPHRTIELEVQGRVRTLLNSDSAPIMLTPPQSITVSNPKPVINLTNVIRDIRQDGSIQITFPDSSFDHDIEGYMVWLELTPGFDPLVTAPFYRGTDNRLKIRPGDGLVDNKTYYMRFAVYDSFAVYRDNDSDPNLSDVEVTAEYSFVAVNKIEEEVIAAKIFALIT